MLRGRYGVGWMIAAWFALAVMVALAVYGAIGVAALIH